MLDTARRRVRVPVPRRLAIVGGNRSAVHGVHHARARSRQRGCDCCGRGTGERTLACHSLGYAVPGQRGARRAGARVWLVTDSPDRAPAEADRTPGLAGVWLRPADGLATDVAVYQIRSSATALRAAAPDRAIGVVLSGAVATAEAARAIAPYIDAVWIPVPSTFTPDEVRIRFPGLTCALETTDTDVLAPQPAHVDTRIVRADDIVPTVLLLSALREWLPQGLAALDEVAIDCDGCRSQVWLHPDTLDAIAVVTTQAGGELRVRPTAIRVAAVERAHPLLHVRWR